MSNLTKSERAVLDYLESVGGSATLHDIMMNSGFDISDYFPDVMTSLETSGRVFNGVQIDHGNGRFYRTDVWELMKITP